MVSNSSITRFSLSLAIVASIVSMKTLGTPMSVADSMTITITRLSFTLSIAITMSNVVTISVVGRVVTVTMVSLGHIDRGSTIARLCFPLSIVSIAISSIVSMKTLGASVSVAAATIGMVGNTTIARLSSGKAGKRNYNLTYRGYMKTRKM